MPKIRQISILLLKIFKYYYILYRKYIYKIIYMHLYLLLLTKTQNIELFC